MASTKGKKRVVFAVEAEPQSEVAIAGSFTDWDPVPLTRQDTKGDARFQKMVYLQEGRYEYKFIINGRWSIDPNCAVWAPNEFGTLNSVVEV